MGQPRSKKRDSVRARIGYRFDNTMARGSLAAMAYLGLLTVAVIAVGVVLAAVFRVTLDGTGGFTHGGLVEDAWQVLVRTLDRGAIKNDAGWGARVLSLVVVVVGILLAGSLIGFITTAINERVANLHRGHNRVLETAHTLILGWSDEVPRIVRELVEAEDRADRAAVVVLSAEPMQVMSDALRRLRSTRRKVVIRSGEPSSHDDLVLMNAGQAKAVIVVRGDDGDAGVIKSVLALRTLHIDAEGPHVVAEVSDVDTAEVLRTAGHGRLLTVSSDTVVAEVTAQACLQAGLSGAFSELLAFAGDEFHLTPVGSLADESYGRALLSFATSSVVGVVSADGEIWLNPPADTALETKDQLLVVARDDQSIHATGFVEYRTASVSSPKRRARPKPLHIVIVGWSGFGTHVCASWTNSSPRDQPLPSWSTIRSSRKAQSLRSCATQLCAQSVARDDGRTLKRSVKGTPTG